MKQELLELLKNEVVEATGCTEPVTVAYAASLIGKKITDFSKIARVDVCVDAALYKNGLRVGIPGIKERGLEIAAALGLVIAKPEQGLRVLENISSGELEQAKGLTASGGVSVKVVVNCSRLFVEVFVTMADGKNYKAVITDRHQNLTKLEEGYSLDRDVAPEAGAGGAAPVIQKYNIKELLDFTDNVSVNDIEFLYAGIERNMKLADEGMRISGGIGSAYAEIMDEGILNDHMVTRAEMLCSAASESRMAGSRLPAMTSAGSGNHGITLFLTIAAVADKSGTDREKLLRALAFGNLITVYIKSFTGTLSAMCGCGVAAGIGACAGIVYMLGGSEDDIFRSMVNMVGSITGLICDGGKEGCAYKIALSSGWAVKAAIMAMKHVSIDVNNGILSLDFRRLFENLGYVCVTGMSCANSAIIDIMGETDRA